MVWACGLLLALNVAWAVLVSSRLRLPPAATAAAAAAALGLRALGGAPAAAKALRAAPPALLHASPNSTFASRLLWMAREGPAAAGAGAAVAPAGGPGGAGWFGAAAPGADGWEPMCASGPAATPALWQASQPAVLSLAYPGWLGVYSAARGVGPVMGTHVDFSEARRASLLALIQATPSLRCVVMHGMPPGMLELASLLHAQAPGLQLLVVYHGALSSPIHEASGEAGLLAQLLALAREGTVQSLGTVKEGFHETLLALGARRALSVPNFPVVLPHLVLQKHSASDGLLHIGVLAGTDGKHKNAIAQLVAACTLPGAVVHVTALPDIQYLRFCQAQIVETGLLPHDQFIVEVTKMDVLLYVSLVECFPMLVLESAAAGIPILVSRTHHIFDSDPVLDRALVVREADSPSEISQRLAALTSPAAREALRPNLLALAGCMQRKAELAWSRFLELSYKERVQLDFLRDLDARALARASDASVCSSGGEGDETRGGGRASALAALAEPPAFGALPPAPFRVALATYELPPFLPGGAGVVIANLIEELLAAGHGVTVLAHVPADVLDRWAALMRERGWESQGSAPGGGPRALVIHHVPTLAGEAALLAHACAPRHLFLQRAGVFAEAVGAAYARAPFDVVEFFDYAGVAFDVVRRLRRWQESPATSRAPFLPPHVPIVVRLHGSVQLIHQSEGVAPVASSAATPPACSSQDESTAWPLMYLMERFSLAGAHAILAQSQAMADLYSAAYGLMRDKFVLAPPPMARVLAPFAGAAWGGGPALGSSGSGRSSGKGGPGGAFRLLVYGRIARMKGSETVAHAISAIRSGLPAGVPLQLTFVGLDWGCPLHGRPTSLCVEEILQGSTRDTDAIEVAFEDPIDRAGLPALARGFHGGVIASEFETFNLAAHELAACDLPLIVSDIPALREFFTPQNAYVFQSASADSLARAALSLYRDAAAGAPRVARLRYGDPLLPYQRLVALARSSPADVAPHDASELSATGYAIGLQSRDCFASYECKRDWQGEVELAD